jgi:hypothetical protein
MWYYAFIDNFLTIWGAFIVLTGATWLTCWCIRFWSNFRASHSLQRNNSRSSDDKCPCRSDASKRE